MLTLPKLEFNIILEVCNFQMAPYQVPSDMERTILPSFIEHCKIVVFLLCHVED